jgi:hypothetical protein
MGFFSSIGGLVGGLFSAPLAIGGALLGGVLDGKKARKAQSRAIAEQNRIATIAAENASRPVITTQKVDFNSTIKDATNAGFNPLTALRATGGNITGTTTRYVAPLLSSMPTRNFIDIMSDAFSGYQSFQKGRTQKLQTKLETDYLKSQIGLNLKRIKEASRFSSDGTERASAFIDTMYPNGDVVRILNPELYEMGLMEFIMGASQQGISTGADALGINSSSPKAIAKNLVDDTSSFADRFVHGFTTGQWIFPKTTPRTMTNPFKTNEKGKLNLKPDYNEPIVPYSMKALGLEY